MCPINELDDQGKEVTITRITRIPSVVEFSVGRSVQGRPLTVKAFPTPRKVPCWTRLFYLARPTGKIILVTSTTARPVFDARSAHRFPLVIGWVDRIAQLDEGERAIYIYVHTYIHTYSDATLLLELGQQDRPLAGWNRGEIVLTSYSVKSFDSPPVLWHRTVCVCLDLGSRVRCPSLFEPLVV